MVNIKNYAKAGILSLIPYIKKEVYNWSIVPMTKCYVDSVLILNERRVDDTTVLAKETGIFGTLYKKKNCGTYASIKKGFHFVPENVFDYCEDIVI